MARKKMVTRTIITTEVTVLCLDIDTAEPCNKSIKLAGKFKSEQKLLQSAKNVLETDKVKVVHIVDTREEVALYGMSEDLFIEEAEVLPPR